MRSAILPRSINPWVFTVNAEQLQGVLPLQCMPRLRKLLLPTEAMVEFSLHGTVDENKIHVLDGRIATAVGLVCQRCLEPFELLLNKTFRLGLLYAESQLNQLPDYYDPLLAGDDLVLCELIEDELLLALPDIPLHAEPQQCNDLNETSLPDTAAGSDNQENPFAVLSALLKRE